MCESCSPPSPQVVEAYEEFNEAVKKFLDAIDEGEGIIVDWTLSYAQSILHQNFDSTYISWVSNLNQSHHRTLGLMLCVLNNIQAEDTARSTEQRLRG